MNLQEWFASQIKSMTVVEKIGKKCHFQAIASPKNLPFQETRACSQNARQKTIYKFSVVNFVSGPQRPLCNFAACSPRLLLTRRRFPTTHFACDYNFPLA